MKWAYRTRRLAAITGAAGAAALLAACGGSDSSSDGADNAKAESGPKKDSMTFLLSTLVPDMDLDGIPNLTQAQLNPQLYSTLITQPVASNEGGVMIPDYRVGPEEYAPGLAESYTREGNTWTFNLRDNAKSCAGNPLTADDVVYTFERHKAQAGALNSNYGQLVAAGVFTGKSKKLGDEVKKIDDRTVQITTTGPNVGMPLTLVDRSYGVIYDSVEMKKQATASDKYAHKWIQKGNAAGFGPYCLESIDGKSLQAVLKANPGFWGEKPQFQRVTVRGVPSSSTRMQAVQTGQADGTTDLAPSEYANLGDRATVLSADNSQVLWLSLNTKLQPWAGEKGKLLRQAVAAALPYDILQAGPLKGAAGPLKSIQPPAYRGTVEFEAPAQDTERAKQLMAEAGYPDGKGLEKFSKGLTLYFNSDANGAFAPQIANQVRTALGEIGIPIKIEPLGQADYSPRLFVKRDLPMAIVVLNPGNAPDTVISIRQFFTSTGQANLTNFANPELDEVIGKTAATDPGSPEYEDGARKAQEILWDEKPVVPLAQLKSQIALGKGMSNWALGPITPVPTFWTFKTGGEQ